MRLHTLKNVKGAVHRKKRVGCGEGGGHGKTSGRGGKGQTARTGVAINGFEGGQMPLFRRLPKKGFNNIFRLELSEVNLGRLQQAIESKRLDVSQTVNGTALVAAGLLSRVRDGVRLLGKGELKTKLTIEVAGASKSAIAAVEKLGGSVIVKAPKPKKEEAKPKAKA